MTGLDSILAKSLKPLIYESLGNEIIKKIESRLSEKGYSLTQAIEEFNPFDKTLREFLGKETDEILLNIFNRIFEIRTDKHGCPYSLLIRDRNLLTWFF